MSGGGSGSTTTVQKSDPWGPVQPYLQSVFSNANSLSASGGPQLNTGQVSAMNPQLTAALNSIFNTGTNGTVGDQTLNGAVGQTQQLANGNFSGLQGAGTLQGLAAGGWDQNALTNILANVAGGTAGGNVGSLYDLAQYGKGQFGGTVQGDALSQQANGDFRSAAGQSLTQIGNGNFAGTNAATLAQLANGQYGGVYGILNGMAKGNFTGTGLDQLVKTSNGAYTDPNNTAVQGLFNAQAQPLTQQFQQSTLPGLLSAYSAAGRYGSGANDSAINSASSALGQTLSNLSQSTIGQNYVNERANQQAAAGTLGGYQTGAASNLAGLQSNASGTLLGAQQSANNTLLGAQQSAASGLLGAQTSSAANMAGIQSQIAQYLTSLQAGSAGQLAGIQGSAISALPGMGAQQNTNTWNNLSNAQTAAQAFQTQQQNELNAGIAQQNQNAQAPYDNLSWLNGILSGASTYKVGTSTAPSSGGGLLGGLGGALAGSSLGSSLGGSTGGALGAIGGGILGIL